MLDAIDEDLNAGLITQDEADIAHERTYQTFIRGKAAMPHCHSYIRHSRFRATSLIDKGTHINFLLSGTNYTPKQLAAFYGFPSNATGTGKKAAVIELGGGYVQADLDTYFKSLGLTVKPVIFHGINGGQNSPGDPNGADGEVMLDLCIIGGMAPDVELHCYMAPNTDAGFLSAINQAIIDKMDAISISWGGPEDQWDAASINAFEAVFAKAHAAGVTVTCAAGDNGSSDGEPGNHVDYPSSSPNVLACGGTTIASTSPIQEVVWNDGTDGGATGGGVSSSFLIPSWQAASNIPGNKYRGVPDVAGNADPNTGWLVIVDGQLMVIGGTSAVAPLWAALACCLSQALGKNVGFMNPTLYQLKGWGRDIVSGNNGTYTARSGWDACTGNGVPIGTRLLAALTTTTPTPGPTPPKPSPTSRVITVTGASAIMIDGKLV
jgi:kumamolisin